MKASIERTEAGSVARVSVGNFRWSICALLFFAATVNYIDRQVIGILKPTLQGLYGWGEIDYSNIVFAFTAAYAIGMLAAGRFVDWLGVRKGFSLVVTFWSIAAMGHSLARSVLGFGAARFALGIGSPEVSPLLSKPLPNGFLRKNVRWQPAYSMPERMSEPSSRRSRSHLPPWPMAGDGHSLRQPRWVSSG